MPHTLVLTLIGHDRAGLVEMVAQTLTDHGANWLDSRMSRLGGRFAGILMVEVEDAKSTGLRQSLLGLEARGLSVVVEDAGDAVVEGRRMKLSLLGQDRPGIVRQISEALASRRVNVEELSTGTRSAPMSGDLLFFAEASLLVPLELSAVELGRVLEGIAADLMVDLSLDEAPSPQS